MYFIYRFGQFLVSLLPVTPTAWANEKSVVVAATNIEIGRRYLTASISGSSAEPFDTSNSATVFRIRLRNVCLEILLRLVTSPQSSLHNGVNAK
jgi:hypothetical protein